jgi:hypothetical protein
VFTKSLRGFSLFLIAGVLLSWSYFPVHGRTQASTDETVRGFDAPTGIAATIFTQPILPNGILYQSSFLDPNGSNNDKIVWDNFTLPATASITEIDWAGGYDPLKWGAGGPVLDFNVKIYPSIPAGTEPAIAYPPLVQYQTGGNASQTSIGTVGGIPMYSYAFILPAPFVASAGVKYWVQIEAVQTGSNPDWGMAAGSGGNGSHYLKESGAGGDVRYHSVPGDTSFSLITVGNAPASIWLPLIIK